MDILGIIPARAGSKGIPRKNLRNLGTKPLLAWTIEAALQSHITRVVVSTEDAAIAETARRYGAEVLIRPDWLAEDNVHAVLVGLDVLKQLQRAEHYEPDIVLMLLPTSPFRTAQHIDAAIAASQERLCPSVVGVYEIQGHTLDTVRTIDTHGWLRMFTDPVAIQQRQDHTPLYRVNGAIFLSSGEALRQYQTFYQKYTLPLVMEGNVNLEIDEPEDLELARFVVATNTQLNIGERNLPDGIGIPSVQSGEIDNYLTA